MPILVTSNAEKSSDIVLADSELILDYFDEHEKFQRNDENKNELISKWRNLVSKKIAPIGKRAVLNRQEKKLFELLAEIDEDVVGPFLCGDELTVADCAAFPFLWRIDQEFGSLNEKDHECGRIRSWIDHCLENKAFKTTLQNNWWWWW